MTDGFEPMIVCKYDRILARINHRWLRLKVLTLLYTQIVLPGGAVQSGSFFFFSETGGKAWKLADGLVGLHILEMDKSRFSP